jgi:hypothetical protein
VALPISVLRRSLGLRGSTRGAEMATDSGEGWYLPARPGAAADSHGYREHKPDIAPSPVEQIKHITLSPEALEHEDNGSPPIPVHTVRC